MFHENPSSPNETKKGVTSAKFKVGLPYFTEDAKFANLVFVSTLFNAMGLDQMLNVIRLNVLQFLLQICRVIIIRFVQFRRAF